MKKILSDKSAITYIHSDTESRNFIAQIRKHSKV